MLVLTRRELLGMLGHHVSSVSSAEEALELLGKSAFDVLLTDIGLSGMSGEDLAALSRVEPPLLEIIYSTGLPPSDAHANSAHRYLTKPYTMAQLEHALQVETLDVG
ncbi:response regulator [Massilia glaciei]|uniref:response regulator n=1 Tax=Massilia glaciei TaxID=1524097 RepID=UPI0015E7F73D|nr:response regulator [Massilia glaciei]